MPTHTQDTTTSNLSASSPAGLASRLREGLTLVQDQLGTVESRARQQWGDLPARLRDQIQTLVARIRVALDVPSRSEIGDLARRVEELDRKLAELDELRSSETTRLDQTLRQELEAAAASVKAEAVAAAEARAENLKAEAVKAAEAAGAAQAPARTGGQQRSNKGGRSKSSGKSKQSGKASGGQNTSGGDGSAASVSRKARPQPVANKKSSRSGTKSPSK